MIKTPHFRYCTRFLFAVPLHRNLKTINNENNDNDDSHRNEGCK